MLTVKCGLQNVNSGVSFLRSEMAALSSARSKCSSLIWQEIRGNFPAQVSLEIRRKIVFQFQVSCAAAWLRIYRWGWGGGKVD